MAEPAPIDEAAAVKALAALAQSMRLRIFRALVGAGPTGLTPGVLAASLGVSAPTLSFHLKELMHAGLVSQQRDGRHLIYRPALAQMDALLGYLAAHCCGGVPCAALPAASCATDCNQTPTPALNPACFAMTDKVYNVLFLCTHNAARSIMAEALLNQAGRGRFIAHSAGSQPSGVVHPLALATLQKMHTPVGTPRSKHWDEFGRADAPSMDFVFTVCDNAAGEVCPVWPGQPITAHWGVSDPTVGAVSEADAAQAFWTAATVLKRRIDLMLALPLASLDRLAIQREVHAIGSR